jgi:hypothetical protein
VETPAVAVEEKKEQPKPEEPAPEAEDKWKERNKNRFGIRIGSNIFFDKLTRDYHLTSYSVPYRDSILLDTTYNFDDEEETAGSKIARGQLFNLFLKGIIKAGQYVTIEIGAGYSRQGTSYEGMYAKRVHTADVVSFPSLGVNFVKRFFPLKINAGIMADLDYLFYTVDWLKRDYSYESFVNDTSFSYFAFNVGLGARTGLEIMAGPHVGFNLDFVYYFSRFTTVSQSYTTYDINGVITYDTDKQWILSMPSFALGLGINFYF